MGGLKERREEVSEGGREGVEDTEYTEGERSGHPGSLVGRIAYTCVKRIRLSDMWVCWLGS